MCLKIICYLIIISLLSCKDNSGGAPVTTHTPVKEAYNAATKKYEDTKYITKVYGSIVTGNEINGIALRRSEDTAVIALATELSERYDELGKRIEVLSANKNIRLNITLRFDQQNHIRFLEQQAKATFDREYLDILAREHKKMLEDFRLTGTNSYDADINVLAAEVLRAVTVSYAHIMIVRAAVISN